MKVSRFDKNQGLHIGGLDHRHMARGKVKSLAIKLVSTAGTGFFYVTRKNPRNVAHKLSLMKYDPIVRQHVVFNESKLK